LDLHVTSDIHAGLPGKFFALKTNQPLCDMPRRNLAGNVLTGTLPASLAYLSESNGGSIQSM